MVKPILVYFYKFLSTWIFVEDLYAIGVLGEEICQSGHGPITSLSVCNDARQSLSISKWNAEKYDNNNGRLPYCWVGPNGGANYNSKGDNGSNFRASTLICKKYRKFILSFKK